MSDNILRILYKISVLPDLEKLTIRDLISLKFVCWHLLHIYFIKNIENEYDHFLRAIEYTYDSDCFFIAPDQFRSQQVPSQRIIDHSLNAIDIYNYSIRK